MIARLLFIPLIIGGLAAICWGLPAAHRLRPPLDSVAALAALAGTALTILGILLVVIPNFFR